MKYYFRVCLLVAAVSWSPGCREVVQEQIEGDCLPSTFEDLVASSTRLSSDLALEMLEKGVSVRVHCPIFEQRLRTGDGVEECIVLGVSGWPDNSGIVLDSDELEALLRSRLSEQEQLWAALSGEIVRNKKFDEFAQIGPKDTAIGFLANANLHGWCYENVPEVTPSVSTKGVEGAERESIRIGLGSGKSH